MSRKLARKICLMGDFAVGKTSLVRRFVDAQFSDSYLATVGVKISRKALEVGEGEARRAMQLVIWDVEGRSAASSYPRQYLRGAAAVILVADLSRAETVMELPTHLELLRAESPAARVAVAYNKLDLIDDPTADNLIGAAPPLEGVVASARTSAKTGREVEALFATLAGALL